MNAHEIYSRKIADILKAKYHQILLEICFSPLEERLGFSRYSFILCSWILIIILQLVIPNIQRDVAGGLPGSDGHLPRPTSASLSSILYFSEYLFPWGLKPCFIVASVWITDNWAWAWDLTLCLSFPAGPNDAVSFCFMSYILVLRGNAERSSTLLDSDPGTLGQVPQIAQPCK